MVASILVRGKTGFCLKCLHMSSALLGAALKQGLRVAAQYLLQGVLG